ncbi:Cation diffusion facilitator family transporter [Trichostrongylus colubriformis]|uniref:Cation diffusion facilitator family transporter n=1 Tax=Trichostrongylus colubriformis TaxID=6319 RepID=A0AAN8F6P9_TRICO
MVAEFPPLLYNDGIEKTKFYGLNGVIHQKSSSAKFNRDPHVGCFERRRRERAKSKYYKELKQLQEQFDYDRQIIYGGKPAVKQKQDRDRLLARISLIMNVTLLLVNLFASISTGSLAIMNTFVDSCIDITTSLVLAVCLWLIHNTSYDKYPRGRERLELLGVILCSIILVVSNTFLILESITAIITDQIAPTMNALVISVMLGGSLLKAILMIICFRRGSASSKVLAMDMRNDIATTLVAVACATVGSLYWPDADPVGGIIVCAMIAISWFYYAIRHIPMLVGVRAKKDRLARVLKVAIEHDPRICSISHAMVFHTSMLAIVEVDIIMDQSLPLKITRDISDSLRRNLLKLDFVETAYVYCDCEYSSDLDVV